MDKKAHEALERIRKDVTLTTSDMENQDAAEFFNELADWAYANASAPLSTPSTANLFDSKMCISDFSNFGSSSANNKRIYSSPL